MPDALATAPLADADSPASLLDTLLAISLTGVMLMRPLYAADGTTIVDLAWVRLNPAAQQLLRLPECPTDSFLTLYPTADAAGVFGFYRDAFLSGHAEHRQNNYQHDGLDGYYHLAAQRQGGLLVVSFIDSSVQAPLAIEAELRQSQARELAARTEAERQRGELQRIFEQAPVAIAAYRGPNYVIELANSLVCSLWGRTPAQALHTPLFELLPEIVGQGYEQLLDQVMATGEPYVAREMPSTIDRHGRRDTVYWNFVYMPLREANGKISGVIVVATEVSEQVLARHQVQALNVELATTNQELRTANAEYLAANTALARAQQALRGLNDELENRVAARTAETRAALQEAEHQREQLREQQGLLSQILSQVPASIATLTGPEHRYSFFNAPYQDLAAGRTVLGRTVGEIFPEVVEQGFIDLLDQVYATGQPFIGTETLIMLHHKDTGQARQRYVDFVYQPLFDGQQQTTGILAFVLDVTDRVLARKQADTLQAAMLAVVKRQGQERENVFQLLEQAPAAICLLRDPSHRIDYLNPAYQDLFPGLELRGRTLALARPEATELVALLDGVYQTGEGQFQSEVLVSIPQPAGSPPAVRFYNFTYKAYRDAGRIAGVSIFGFDVTDRVLVRRQRDAQQAELQRIFEQAPVAIAIMRGPALVVELANAAVGAIWGRPPAQVLGRPYFEALPDTAGQGFEQILADVLQTGKPFLLTEAPVQLDRAHTGQPTQAFVNFVFQPLLDEQQHPTGLIAVGTEVTDQVLARRQVQDLNRQLLATNDRLTHTNTDLDTFVYSASHDLKSPITNIEGLLMALRAHLPPNVLQDPVVPRLLGMMAGAVGRFQQTLGHLTNIARLQQEPGPGAEAVDLPALVEGVRLDILPELTAAGATLQVDLANCPTVYFSAKNLRSIVYNLLSNAVKFRDPGRPPLVQLRGHAAPGQVVLEVQDNGLGLSTAQQGELFRMFRRLHTHVEGSGVGLYMVKKIIDNAGGSILVKSEVGLGSTFTVVLPVPASAE